MRHACLALTVLAAAAGVAASSAALAQTYPSALPLNTDERRALEARLSTILDYARENEMARMDLPGGGQAAIRPYRIVRGPDGRLCRGYRIDVDAIAGRAAVDGYRCRLADGRAWVIVQPETVVSQATPAAPLDLRRPGAPAPDAPGSFAERMRERLNGGNGSFAAGLPGTDTETNTGLFAPGEVPPVPRAAPERVADAPTPSAGDPLTGTAQTAAAAPGGTAPDQSEPGQTASAERAPGQAGSGQAAQSQAAQGQTAQGQRVPGGGNTPRNAAGTSGDGAAPRAVDNAAAQTTASGGRAGSDVGAPPAGQAPQPRSAEAQGTVGQGMVGRGADGQTPQGQPPQDQAAQGTETAAGTSTLAPSSSETPAFGTAAAPRVVTGTAPFTADPSSPRVVSGTPTTGSSDAQSDERVIAALQELDYLGTDGDASGAAVQDAIDNFARDERFALPMAPDLLLTRLNAALDRSDSLPICTTDTPTMCIAP
ncbi:hypothetical protein ATO13_02495 [Stappia sp. 22II-S9-Z10]|nr:hypothetical protein ATO13_02495 [Stappia sp. 22II-S9-Z10]